MRFVDRPSFGAEEYRLELGPSVVEIAASSAEGALRAASTLWQLVLSQGPRLPCLLIEDGPRFSWRGAMLDTARNYFSPEFIERFLDLMALHKLNRFHWHLTDDQAWRLDLAGLPELAARGSRRLDRRFNVPRWKEGSYSPSEVRRIVAFAAERGIVVVPEIETPGHVTALLASHPELSCASSAQGGLAFEPEDRYGVFEDVLCAGDEKVFDLLGRVFDEMAELFPGPWLHAGGDEVPKARWSTCPKCRTLMKRENLRDEGGALEPELLQGWFMNRVASLLAARGKRMVGWDEILEGRVRRDAVVMSWRGTRGGIEAAKAGHEVVMSPQTHACYLDHKQLDIPEEPGQLGVCTLRDSYAFDPIPPGLSAEEAARILGGQANLWTELMYFGSQVEYMAFPRLCALSEVFWSPKASRGFDDFLGRMETHGRRLDRLGVNRYRGAAG
jgi:hexosaminidase